MEAKNDYNIVIDVDENQLEFQDYTTEPNLGATRGPVSTLSSRDPVNVATSTPTQGGSIWNISYWSVYFDVDTKDVIQKIVMSIMPQNEFFDAITAKPDLWGPFWVPTSVIYFIFVAYRLSIIIVQLVYGTPVEHDISMFFLAFAVVYMYVGIMSVILSFTSKYFGLDCTLIEAVSVYGYSTSVWILVSLACMLKYPLVRWISVAIGFGISCLFMLQNLGRIANKTESRPNLVLNIIVISSLAAFSLGMKFLFYSY